MKRRLIYLLIVMLAGRIHGYAQQEALTNLVNQLRVNQQNTLQEKVFLHLDRTFYVGGETMWFKAYVMDGYFHHALNLSKVVYVDVLDRNQQPFIQTKISLEDGKGNGSIPIPASLDSDNYTVRAYTNWMKNFSPDFYFHQNISIVNVFQRLEEKNKNQDNGIDVQFFPEGGELVDGVKSKIAFKVVDSSGKGISFTGTVISKSGETLATFHPLKFGMGHFTFTPNANEQYRVLIKEENGKVTSTELPAIQTQGYVLTITDDNQDQLKVTITGKGMSESSPIFLIAHNRQLVKYAGTQNLIDGQASLLLSKKNLGNGIVHLTVFNQNRQPVCERLYFNRPSSSVSIQLNVDKPRYEQRDKIFLQIKLSSDQSQWVNTSLSIFKNDSLQQIQPADIQSYLWLGSELKGNIESPEYYFSEEEAAMEAMDNLMLTHGWTRFKWEEVLQSQPKTFLFIPEYRGHLINGKVLDKNTSQPVKGIGTYLGTPDKKIHPYMAHSDANGHVRFETSNMFGFRKLILHTGSNQNNSRIELESPFSSEVSKRKTPYLKLSEQVKAPLIQRSISMQSEDIFFRGRIRNHVHAADSSAFYGNASEHYRLDDFTRFPLMEEVMREYVKGVRIRNKEDQFVLKVVDMRRMEVFDNNPLILLDGVAIFDVNKIMNLDPLKIKSIDVVTSRYFLGEFNFDGVISLSTYLSDQGGYEFDPGTIIMNYDGLQQQQEFYAPRYESQADRLSRLPDQRNLLLWVSDVTINQENQNLEFYSSDQTGVFKAIIQGISQHGQPVYQTHTFEVKAPRN